MNIFQELKEKYNGQYSEALATRVNTPNGQCFHQSKSTILQVDGSKISLYLDEVGGAIPITEPFRITLHLDKTYHTELDMYPKSSWARFLDFLLPKRQEFVPEPILKQFWFGGNKTLIKQITTDKLFTDNIINQRIYIKTMPNKSTNRIVLTPENGVEDVDQFEKFVSILKRIENKIIA